MSITMMCDKSAPGAFFQPYPGSAQSFDGVEGVWMRESHVGIVLGLYERNGYDDSDFYAVVWNPEKGEPTDVCYASTRGWTYPNGAKIDATPEVVEAYRAWKQARDDAFSAARAKAKAESVEVGSAVEVDGDGTGTAFWIGVDRFDRSGRYGPRLGAPKMRIGVQLDDGRKGFFAASKVRVAGASRSHQDAAQDARTAELALVYTGRPGIAF